MRLEFGAIVIRSAQLSDAYQLNRWWNDGKVMAHAGFPNGLNQPLDETEQQIRRNEGHLSQLCMIEIQGRPVGELSYRILGGGEAECGWKICESNFQNQGYGPKIILHLFHFLFSDEAIAQKHPIEKIHWDTNAENKRAQHVYEDKIGAKLSLLEERAWQDQLDRWQTAIHYEMTKDDFYSKHDIASFCQSLPTGL